MARPPDPDPLLRKTISLRASTWKLVEDYRFDARVRTETEAVRKLIEAGYAALKRDKQDPEEPP